MDSQRVTLTWRDTALIARIFAMRPAWFRAYRRHPDESDEAPSDSIRVEYRDPQVLEPDSLVRARVRQERRAYQASVNWIAREIHPVEPSQSGTWLEVGDSVQFRIEDRLCSYDFCHGTNVVLDSGWTVVDTTVARLHAAPPRPHNADRLPIDPPPAVTLVALQRGRTRLRVVGLHGPSDSVPTNRPPPRWVERDVVVTVPVDRVRMSPRPDIVRLGDTLMVVARAFDRAGREIPGAPITITLRERGAGDVISVSPFSRIFAKSGQKTLIATFAHRADTLTVTAIDRKTP